MRGALLGLLLERPGHGGDLASRLAARLGETWRVDTNDVYRLLEQLENTGLAVSRNQPTYGDQWRPLAVYHPTEASSEALTLWMETLLPREPMRLGLQAKLSVARPQDAPRMLIALKAHQRECLMLAKHVSPTHGQADSWAALCLDCSREAVLAQLSAEVDWAARTHRRIKAAGTPATRSRKRAFS
jgi:DNA-binding PadR family transcriptional regulator